jgi:hypothetical protein
MEETTMAASRYLALTICAFAIAPALAASVPLGDPFHVRHAESVELAHGVKLKFVDVRDERCPGDVTCVWQGEAFVEVELLVNGQTARGSITTEKPDATLLAHSVKLLGLYPQRISEQTPAKDYVAFLRVADTASRSATALANRDAALAATSHYVSTYARAANEVCADWRQRQLTSYIERSGGLCSMISKVSPKAHAFTEGPASWSFFFLVDDPQMRTPRNESLYLVVSMSKAPADPFDLVRKPDVVTLPCEVTLLEGAHSGCNWSTR